MVMCHLRRVRVPNSLPGTPRPVLMSQVTEVSAWFPLANPSSSTLGQ